MKFKNNTEQIEETELDSKNRIGSETKKTGDYTEREKKIFNEYLKGIYNPRKRRVEYELFRTNKIIIQEEGKTIPKPNQEPIIHKIRLLQKQIKSEKPCIYSILWIITVLILLCVIGSALYLYLKPIKYHSNFEKLISSLTYKKNQILKFQNIKTTTIDYEFGNIDAPNERTKLIEYFDFVIVIASQDKVVENNTEKEVFSGFIFLENYMIDNETEKMLMQNSSLIEESEKAINLSNLLGLRNIEEKKYFNFTINDIKPYCCIDNGTLPIMKFDFYRNGKINKIYKPKNLNALFYDRMIEILEKVIPRIAEEDFNNTYNNISEALENEYQKIRSNNIEDEYSSDEFEEEENEYMEEEKDENISNYGEEYFDEEYNENEEEKDVEIKGRRVSHIKKKSKLIKIKYRNLDTINENGNNSFNFEEMNEIIAQEFTNENDFNVYMYDKDKNDGNTTNLNYYTHSPVRNNYAEFKGSQQNTSINSTIDENKNSLKEVHYINKGKLMNDTNFGEELEKERKNSCSNDNLLDCKDMANDTFENVIDSKFKSIDYEIIEDILSTGNYIDNSNFMIQKFSETFQKYENDLEIEENYELTNSSKRLLRDITSYILANKFEYSDVEIQMGRDEKRNLDDEYTGYYGMKNMKYSKNLFNLNIIGIQMKLQITNTMIVKEGKSVVKIIIQFAFIKISITLKTINTNMHLAIRNYNEMGFTELYLINESNEKLEKRNQNYSDISINLEKDFNNLLVNKHDFSNIFKDSFSEMYEKN